MKLRCPVCNSEMKNIMHFEKNKCYAYHKCEKCTVRTHPKRIHFDEIKRVKDKKNYSISITK